MFGNIFGKKNEKNEKNEIEVDDNGDKVVGTVEIQEGTKISTPETNISIPETMSHSEEVLTKDEKPEVPSITRKEYMALKKSSFMKRCFKIDESKYASYILRNEKTQQIVEVKGASSYQACKSVGWKSNKVSVLKVIEPKVIEPKVPVQTEEPMPAV